MRVLVLLIVSGVLAGSAIPCGVVTGAEAKSIWRIVRETNKARPVPIRLLGPDSLAVSDRAIWVSANSGSRVARVDPRTLKVVARWHVGKNPFPAAFAFGDVWVPVSGGRTIVRFHIG
jgi:hypothetical protein